MSEQQNQEVEKFGEGQGSVSHLGETLRWMIDLMKMLGMGWRHRG